MPRRPGRVVASQGAPVRASCFRRWPRLAMLFRFCSVERLRLLFRHLAFWWTLCVAHHFRDAFVFPEEWAFGLDAGRSLDCGDSAHDLVGRRHQDHFDCGTIVAGGAFDCLCGASVTPRTGPRITWPVLQTGLRWREGKGCFDAGFERAGERQKLGEERAKAAGIFGVY